MKAIANKVNFGYRAPDDKNLIVQVKALTSDPNYDAYFLVIGSDLDSAFNRASILKVRALLENAVSTGKNEVLAADIQIYQDSRPQGSGNVEDEAPDPKYDAIRNQML